MYLLVSGFRYKNAPLEVRERFSFSKESLPEALNKLLKYPSIKEAIILSTCNRTEIYTLVEDTEIGTGSVVRFLSDYHNLSISEIRKYMFTLMHEDTVRQIYKVTSGIDSMILGETQITKQVKEAFNIAKKAKSIDKVLTRLFTTALFTSKKIKSSTSLGSLINDVPSGGIELAKEMVGDFSDKQITIIGAGNMASLAVKCLIAKYEYKNIILLNRSAKSIINAYTDYQLQSKGIDTLKETLLNTDILFVYTSAPHYIIKPEHIPESKELIIVDITVPRNVDPEVSNNTNVRLFNIDDIQKIIKKRSEEKNIMLAKADNIVKEETEKFMNWLLTLNIVPTITKLREKIESIRQNKVEKFRSKVCPYSNERCLIIEELSKQIVNTILHDPTVRIKSTQSHEQLYQTAVLLNEMFDLGENL